MACRSASAMRQNPACWRRVLPEFVTEAQAVTGVLVTHHLYSNAITLTTEFIAETDQAKLDFPLAVVGDYTICHACGGWAHEYDITQFGVCEHLICNNCLDATHCVAQLYDGSPCCSHPVCVKEMKGPSPSPSSIKKKTKKKQAMPVEGLLNTSSSDDGCLLVMVYYKLILHDKKGDKIVIDKKKDRLSDTRMDDLIREAAEVLGQFDGYQEEDHHKGAWYYAACNNAFNRGLMTKYKAEEMAQKQLGKVVGQADRLYLVLDLTTGAKKKTK